MRVEVARRIMWVYVSVLLSCAAPDVATVTTHRFNSGQVRAVTG
jgi:hypothetical protein